MTKYDLIRDNVAWGTSFEKPWREALRKKYPSICNKNISDKFASMDSISNDNGIIIEHEHKKRKMKHDKYCSIVFNRCKFEKSVKQVERGIRQIYWWTCTDGLFYWELYDIDKQKDEFEFGWICNKKIGQKPVRGVYIKVAYLKKYED
tara:strand:- start:549 stop:992 length:444 start_codon:yes stop_codon:yes gene_type:complete